MPRLSLRINPGDRYALTTLFWLVLGVALSSAVWLNVVTAYVGPAKLSQAPDQNSAQPLSLSAGDFDEDGVADLVGGYANGDRGFLSLYRGNVDALYPNTPEARQRTQPAGKGQPATPPPFHSTPHLFDLPVAPDFVGAGDFDADGHLDLVVAARGGTELYLIAGNGKGEFSVAKEIELWGRVTALVAGEVNRADGLADVVVGITDGGASKALVFEGPEGALRAQAEEFALPGEAAALALGRVDQDYLFDLAVAAGRELVVVHGRDRCLSFDQARREAAPAAKLSRLSLSSTVRSVAIGNFTDELRAQVAALGDDGVARMTSSVAGEWKSETLNGSWPQADRLIGARVSGGKFDDLVVLDAASNRLLVVNAKADGADRLATEFKVEGTPVAAVAMRLGVHARNDLVSLRRGQSAPVIVTPQSATANFVVNSTENGSDANPGNGACATSQGICTLRAAIEEANANPGPDIINFSIGSGPQTISPTPSGTPPVHLPDITGPVTIDATTQPGFAGAPIIEVSGALAGSGQVTGLTIRSNDCVVRGLVINRFSGNGIRIVGSNNIVEGNYIGTDRTGALPARNIGNGVFIDGTTFGTPINVSNNRIGGTTPAARNVISDNGENGVLIDGSILPGLSPGSVSSATGNRVQGNYIGSNRDGSTGGTFDLGNNERGVYVVNASSNIIGGEEAGAGNLIIDNGIVGEGSIGGVEIAAQFGETAEGNRVQGNLIGVNSSAALGLGNFGDGVQIYTATNTTVGGTSAVAGNVISGNRGDGIDIIGAAGTVAQGNFIGTDRAGSRVGNVFNGVFVSSLPQLSAFAPDQQPPPNLIGGTVAGARNVIAFNGGSVFNGAGVSVLSSARNSILGNSIFSNLFLGIDLGDDGVTQNDGADADNGPNNLQNYPVLTSAVTNTVRTTVNGALNSTPNTTFRIEFFSNASCDSSGFGEGETFLEARNVTTDASGAASFSLPLSSTPVPPNRSITATATDPNGNTSEFSRCVPVVAATSDLAITKTDSPDPVNAGSPLTYTITVSNAGPNTATNVVVTDALPAGVTFSSVTTSQGSCTAPPVGGTGTVTCSIGSLSPPTPPQQATITLVVRPTVGGTITNTAVVTSDEFDPNMANNRASQSTTVIGEADLSITKSASPSPVFVNNLLTYTLTVSNSGPATATGVTVVDTLPQNVSLSSAGPTQGSCSASAGTVTCNLGSVQPQATVTITIIVNVSPSAAGTITNTARVNASGGQNDPNQSNNTASVTTPVTAVANLVISKTATPLQPGPGDDLSYAVRVTNSGPNAATEVLMTDAIPANTSFKSFSIASGATNWTCSTPPVGAGGAVLCRAVSALPAESVSFVLVVTVNNNVPRNTTITNTAEVQSPTFDSDKSNNSATSVILTGAPVVVVTGGRIEVGPITALISPSSNPASGTFVITNSGNSPLYLTPIDLLRVSPNVDKLTPPADDRSLWSITSEGGVPLTYGPNGVIFILPAQQLRFRAIFNPIIPMRAGRTSGLAANQALPDLINSRLRLASRDGQSVSVDLIGRVSTSAKMIHPLDPTRNPLVTLTQSSDRLVAECWVYDSNHDVYLMRYQFLNSSGGAIGSPVDVDIAGAISQAGLARGQVFGVEQAFEGAANLGVARVRVTVYDRDNNNDTALSGAIGAVEPAIASVSAASFTEFGLSRESIVAGFGGNLAAGTQAPTSNPLPTSLGGVSVRIRDGAGIERLAPLFFVSPGQINYQLPDRLSPGAATVTVMNGGNTAAIGAVRVVATWPGLFTANGDGKGVAAAVALRIGQNGSQSYEPVARYDQAQQRFVPIPIDPGPASDQVYLIFFGTGIRHRLSPGAVGLTIGGVSSPVLFAGAQGELSGLDQVNVLLPRSLSGRGEVDVALTVDGYAANVARVSIGGAPGLAGLAPIAPASGEASLRRSTDAEFRPREIIVLPPVRFSPQFGKGSK